MQNMELNDEMLSQYQKFMQFQQFMEMQNTKKDVISDKPKKSAKKSEDKEN